jgi:uncharacterized membrane protein
MTMHFGTLDHHFDLPPVARLEPTRPIKWLIQGWKDLWWNPVPSLVYGLALSIWGWTLITLAAPYPHLVTAAVSGFFLVAPIVVAGLYGMSRGREQGKRVGFEESFAFVRRNHHGLDLYVVLMVAVVIAWERISAILFALFYDQQAPDIQNFVLSAFLSGDCPGLGITGIFAGFVLAVVFVVSAVSVPMMVDRPVDTITAIMTSVRAVSVNMPAMALWAALIVALTAIGFGTFLFGFVIIMPVLAHATWHAYRDMVR